MTTIRYERRADVVVPVRIQREQNGPGGEWRAVRVTELAQMPRQDEEVWRDFDVATEDGYLAFHVSNSRGVLMLHYANVLQTASEWPRDEPCLYLDAAAFEWHERDQRQGFCGCDNPWVAELYGDESEDISGEI